MRHVGLGAGTMLALGAITAVRDAFQLDLTAEEILRLSGRGGTSGVGYHAFRVGGFVIDGGQPNVGQPIGPSAATRPITVPPLLFHSAVPSSWRFALLLPNNGVRVYGQLERSFFAKNTPTPGRDVDRAFRELFQVMAISVLDDDIRGFCEGLAEYQSLGLKPREIRGQPTKVGQLLEQLQSTGMCAAGMSSLGPIVFAVHLATDERTKEHIERLAGAWSCRLLGSYAGNNSGHSLDL